MAGERVGARRAVVVEGLHKRFGATVALDGVDLEVPEGTVLGLLGPNGAGKTTVVRILTTLLEPDEGRAEVLGYDVTRHPAAVRRGIGLAGQYAAVDPLLTGRENLELFGGLYHMPRERARRRARELLERFDLVDAADRAARGYSGGMRRRLDLAASLVNEPHLLFLDEPTTGLDPRSRIDLWRVIEDLVSGGTTLLLTTQYLEEADRLADAIAVIDCGRVIARGTSDQLKEQVGGEVLDVRVADTDVEEAVRLLDGLGHGEPSVSEGGRIALAAHGAEAAERDGAPRGAELVTEAARRFAAAHVDLRDLALRRPTLDDVFLTLTGRVAEDAEDAGDAPFDRSAA